MTHPYMARGSLPGMDQLVTNKGADTVSNDDYVGPSESTKRLMLQPNEQLTNKDGQWYYKGDEIFTDEAISFIMQENKRLNGLLETLKEAISAVVTDSREYKQDTEKWIESVTTEARGYLVQLQQTREELEQVKKERDKKESFIKTFENIKSIAERKIESLNTELSAKDKVLQWLVKNLLSGYEAKHVRDVLKLYPPREKGAME